MILLYAVLLGVPVLVAVLAFARPIAWVKRRRHRTLARTVVAVIVGTGALVLIWGLLVLWVLYKLNYVES